MQNRLFIAFFFFLLITLKANGDSWTDPEWKDMIYQSELIALVKYVSEGDFRAKAIPLTIYKGTLQSKEIWITGFSNKYGPIDKMKSGDKYIVFLNRYELTQETLEYWAQQVENDPELLQYFEALKAGNAYYVWTPTSGDLKVKGNRVKYNLLQTTNSSKHSYNSLKAFEEFLVSISREDKVEFHSKILEKLKGNSSTKKSTTLIMMLYLSSFKDYDPIYEQIVVNGTPEDQLALAKLLGQVQDEKARDILVLLLDKKNSIVQGEAVRQLASQTPEFIGPILLSHLGTAGDTGLYPSNIMDPVMNSLDGGKLEIIKTLGKIKYKPAIEELLPLLETDNEYLFSVVIEVLIELDSKDYVEYLNKHLEDGTRDLVLDICFIITDNELSECIPSLMHFISSHDKSIHPSMEYTISKEFGLSHFDTEAVRRFLYRDFLSVLLMDGGETIDNKKDWVIEYMNVFRKLEITNVKYELYDFLFEYYGLNTNFRNNPEYFKRKFEIEDSLIKKVIKVLKPLEPTVDVSASAFIDSNFDLLDYSIKYKIETPDNFDIWKDAGFEKLNNLIVEQTTIDKSHLIWSAGNYTGYNGATYMLNFGNMLMSSFLRYISSYPDQKDINFLQNLKKYKYGSSNYREKQLDKFIYNAKQNIDD